MSAKPLCSLCRKTQPAKGQRYCLKCRRDYMRGWRVGRAFVPINKLCARCRKLAATKRP